MGGVPCTATARPSRGELLHVELKLSTHQANQAIKRLLAEEKFSVHCVLSISSESGVKCVDTNSIPPNVIMSNAISEIAYFGVDAMKQEYITSIVGEKGKVPYFSCHVLKCASKDIVSLLCWLLH